MDDVYCYPGTDTLINKLGIHDQDKLQDAERRITARRLDGLMRHSIHGDFDLNHLCAIHKYLFQDLYDWAGKIRTVDIAKGNMFCNVKFIQSQADEIFGRIAEEDYLSGLSQEDFAIRLAYHFSEINALHPFREGNGRTQREFARTLALKNGYALDFSKISNDEMITASQASFLCDYTKMEEVFLKCIRKK